MRRDIVYWTSDVTAVRTADAAVQGIIPSGQLRTFLALFAHDHIVPFETTNVGGESLWRFSAEATTQQ
jgi:hypothetical protein